MKLTNALVSGLRPLKHRAKHLGVRLRLRLVGLGHWSRSSAQALLRGFDRLARGVVRGAFQFAGERLGPITVVALAAAVILSVCNWEWLQNGVSGPESGSTTLRNLSFVFAGLIALPLAIWRSLVSERQADATQRQAATAQQNLLNERYQRGADMLGNDVLAVRLGGIYALQRLAKEHPGEYHVQIMRLLCAFVRNPTVDGNGQVSLTNQDTGEGTETDDGGCVRLRQDVEGAMEAIASRSKEGISLERYPEFVLDLSGAELRGLNLMNLESVDLSRANISNANLSHINLRPHTDMSWSHAVNTNLSGASLVDVNLSVVCFWGTDLSQTILTNANLSRASFLNTGDRPCRLTQAQLDSARADPGRPPTVAVMDAETGEPLVWRFKLLRDQV